MWSEGSPILFDWCQYLEEELPGKLFEDLGEPLELESVDAYRSYKSAVLEALTFLLEEREQTCAVCYESLVGAEKFTITRSCFHYFCKECIRDYLVTNVSQGRVVNIACPSAGCGVPLGRAELVDSGASEEIVKKFDEFVFNMVVEKDDKVTWCPRPDCSSPANLIPNSTQGRCQTCYFHFCSECEEKYHNYDLCPANPDPP